MDFEMPAKWQARDQTKQKNTNSNKEATPDFATEIQIQSLLSAATRIPLSPLGCAVVDTLLGHAMSDTAMMQSQHASLLSLVQSSVVIIIITTNDNISILGDALIVRGWWCHWWYNHSYSADAFDDGRVFPSLRYLHPPLRYRVDITTPLTRWSSLHSCPVASHLHRDICTTSHCSSGGKPPRSWSQWWYDALLLDGWWHGSLERERRQPSGEWV